MEICNVNLLYSLPAPSLFGQAISGGTATSGGKESMHSILENLPELWSEDQYRSEYDLSSFMKSLTSADK